LFFLTGVYGRSELWRSDGTAGGTLLVKSLQPDGSYFSAPDRLYVVGHHLFFAMNNPTLQLWRSNGTVGGTVMVKELGDGSYIYGAVATKGILYFATSAYRPSLWRSDGTMAGTYSFLTANHIAPYTTFRGEVIFNWSDTTFFGLCRSSGAPPVCFDKQPISSGSWDFRVRELNDRLLYNVPDIRASDGVSASSLGIGTADDLLLAAAGRMYFRGGFGYNLMETDGKTLAPVISSGEVREVVESGGRLFISAQELYAYDLPVAALSFAPQTVTAGQTVTITGRGFTAPASVRVDGTAVAATVLSSTAITFIAPSREAGTYLLELNLGDGRQMKLADPLQYTCSVPNAVIGPTTVDAAGWGAVLHGSGAARCAWFPATGLSDSSSCTPTASPRVSTTYTLLVFNDAGCTSANHPTVRVSVPRGDITGDRNADLIWRNMSTGANAFWAINGTLVPGGGTLPSVPLGWDLGGVDDFNGDSRSDLVWRNTASGQTTVWFMNGPQYASQQNVFQYWASPEYKLRAVGDLDGNGTPDLVYRSTDVGNPSFVNFMNGTVWASLEGLPAVPDPAWDISGAADIDGDGFDDLVWHNSTTGDAVAWFMNGAKRVRMAFIGRVPTSWRIAAVGDLNGDGYGDLVWHHQAGDVAAWFLRDAEVLGGGFIGAVRDTNWKIVGPR
jgi:ELWxxDGT repeat protein